MNEQKRFIKLKSYFGKGKAILLAFIVIFVLLSVFADNFLTVRNLLTVLRQVSIIGIVSLGMTLVIISGNIDLSVGSIMAITGIVAALLAKQAGWPFVVCLVFSVIVGGLIGLINGLIIAKGKIPAFIATLGMMTALRGVAMILSNGVPIGGLPKDFAAIGSGNIFGLPTPIVVYFVMICLATLILKKTSLGRHIYAVGGNGQAARLSGIDIDMVKVKLYVMHGLMTGLAGVILASRIKSGQPNVAMGYDMDAIAACIIGGVSFNGGIGTALGTVLGTLIIGVINNGLDLLAVQSYYQQIIKGLIIVAAVLLDRKRAV